MDLSTKQLVIGIGVIVATSGGITSYFTSSKTGPTYVIEAQMSSVPDDAGNYTLLGSVSQAQPVFPDASVPDVDTTPDALPTYPDAAPIYPDANLDATFADAAALDANPLDASSADAVADVGPSDIGTADSGPVGIFVPPSSANVPVGASLTVNVLPLPNALSSVYDPQFNVPIKRLLSSGFHEYAQLEPWSDDNKYILLFNESRVYTVYAYPSMLPVASNTAWAAMRWLPGTGHKLIYILGQPVRVMQYDVDTAQVSLLYQAPAPFVYSFTSEADEQPSEDGQWIPMYNHNGNGVNKTMQAVNINNGTVGASIPIASLIAAGGGCTSATAVPDFIAVTPLSKYLGVQWQADGTTRCHGLELFDIDTGAFVRSLHSGHNHGSWSVSVDNRETYSTVQLNSYPTIVTEYLDGSPTKTVRLVSWDPSGNGSAFGHVSCLGPHGQCLVSGEGQAYSGGPLKPYLAEIYLVAFDGTVIRLAHHRSAQSGGYWTQPSAAISKDGHHAVWNSDWGQTGIVSPFEIDIP